MKRKQPVLLQESIQEYDDREFLYNLYLGLLFALEEHGYLNFQQVYQMVELLKKKMA